MSTSPFWSLNFDIRRDVDAVQHRVLTAVAKDVAPDEDDLRQLHPVPRYYLADWRRMLTGEIEPMSGSPVRISTDPRSSEPAHALSIEFSQHDDEFANGGWAFWLWVLQLVARPTAPGRRVIGYHGLYRCDGDTTLVYVDRDGIDDSHARLSFDELDSQWGDVSSDTWADWHA